VPVGVAVAVAAGSGAVCAWAASRKYVLPRSVHGVAHSSDSERRAMVRVMAVLPSGSDPPVRADRDIDPERLITFARYAAAATSCVSKFTLRRFFV
jgi:hypothetical protein